MTISVEKTSSHGFADLAITAHVTEVCNQDDEFSDTGKRTVRKVVKYDGQSYDSSIHQFWQLPPSDYPKCIGDPAR